MNLPHRPIDLRVCCMVVPLILGWLVLPAQNLVVNPSFEDTSCCPLSYHNTHCSSSWTTNMNSWDFFHACSTGEVSVPTNFAGEQMPASGSGYSGFIAWGPNPLDTPPYFPVEIVGGTLSQPLITGAEYFISFKVSLADRGLRSCYTDKLGILFVDTDHGTVNYPAVGRPPVVQDFAHVFADEAIVDSSGWYTIQGSFTADGSYSHFLIGRFFTDTPSYEPCWAEFSNPNRHAYYYLDDVCVSDRSGDCIVAETGIDVSVTDREIVIRRTSPSTIEIALGTELNSSSVDLFDALGRSTALVRNASGSVNIDIAHLAVGVHTIVIRSKEGRSISRPFIIQ